MTVKAIHDFPAWEENSRLLAPVPTACVTLQGWTLSKFVILYDSQNKQL